MIKDAQVRQLRHFPSPSWHPSPLLQGRAEGSAESPPSAHRLYRSVLWLCGKGFRQAFGRGRLLPGHRQTGTLPLSHSATTRPGHPRRPRCWFGGVSWRSERLVRLCRDVRH